MEKKGAAIILENIQILKSYGILDFTVIDNNGNFKKSDGGHGKIYNKGIIYCDIDKESKTLIGKNILGFNFSLDISGASVEKEKYYILFIYEYFKQHLKEEYIDNNINIKKQENKSL